jgi:glycosyltransferase involved in cell wall biosynthesis
MQRSIRQLVFVSDAPHFGGAERYIVDMVLTGRRRGIDSSVCWLPGPASDDNVFDTARRSGIRVESVAAERTRTLRGLSREFTAMLRHEEPDALVINACGRPRFWLLPWLARRVGIPALWVHQMVDASDHRRLPARWLGGRLEGLHLWRVPQTLRHRLAYTAATAVVTLNDEDRDRIARWQGARRERIIAIPHGVDCDRFRFDPDGRQRWRRKWGVESTGSQPFIIGTAGRLSREKGIDLLIQAAAIARREGLPLMLVVAGQGSERDALTSLAADLGISDAVRLVSFIEDMPAFYSALDVFALCSRTESFGLALAEAMSCRRPVIATPTSGATRQISHRHNGWQLGTFDPAEIAKAITVMAADPQGCEIMGHNARDSVVWQFSIDLTLERTLRALRGPSCGRSAFPRPETNEQRLEGLTAEDCT